MPSAGKALAAAVLLAGALITPGAPVASADTPITIVNSASFQDGPVPTGALLTIYTSTPVSAEKYAPYDPWVLEAHGGLRVEASCASYDDLKPMPISFVGTAFSGNHINFYHPNSIGSEPFGSCAYTGPSKIRIHAAGGGAPIESEVVMLLGHPGIFMAGEAPAGDHVTNVGTRTSLSDCRTLLERSPTACPVRTGGVPSELQLHLTGAEWFLCGEPCNRTDIFFELATAPDAAEGSWVPQQIWRIQTAGTGYEQARIRLRADTRPGVYYLRVRNTFRPEYPTPLRIDLGQPI